MATATAGATGLTLDQSMSHYGGLIGYSRGVSMIHWPYRVDHE